MDQICQHVLGMENGNQSLKRFSAHVDGFVTTAVTPPNIPVLDFMFILNMTVCFIPVMCDNPLYILHVLSDSTRDLPTSDTNICCSGFLIAETNVRTCQIYLIIAIVN